MNHTFKFTLLALAIASVCATAAQAETLFLSCGKYHFAVDLASRTVNGKPAEVTPMTIVWDNDNAMGNVHFVIDRSTGALTETATLHQPSGDISMRPVGDGTCTKESAPEMKF
jgi:hypothetical protein